ncbi:ABC transporter permease [Nitratireductor sp. GZWM139]|uniref:ABC transporter permease n=1 Tax=Nitratireductor sp. GZWM139 TaxID=2950541 RepID=UPI0024BE9B72|nr:ABC transporter permease [Nitratireductor sp. GZWM139]MDJ1466144.1 ABC transporter permease [Nitratireductor sp. GZWM139]
MTDTVQPSSHDAMSFSTEEQRRRMYRRIARSQQLRYALLVVPLILYLLVFYIYPVAAMLADSVIGPQGLTLQYFARMAETPIYWRVFSGTVWLAVITTLVCLVLAYPLAYAMSRASPTRAMVMFALVLLPFWTSILVRSYAWMVLLGRNGIFNDWLMRAGLTTEPLNMLYTTFAVYVSMVYVLLPFMILPLYSVLRSIDSTLLRAAEGMGASRGKIFLHVVAPLSKPGVAAGCLVVFILALGFYITPALLGGQRDVTIAMLIAQQLDMYEWNFAAVLASLLLFFSLLVFAIFDRMIGIERMFVR